MLSCRHVFWGGLGLVFFFWCGGVADFLQTSVCGIGGAGCSVLFWLVLVAWLRLVVD